MLRDDVVVEVGGWEHACCGPAIERNQVVDLQCIRHVGPDGEVHLVESHHGGLGVAADERVRGRVTDIHVVRPGDARQPVLRVPSGAALRGFDEHDDGHLEDPWTGEVLHAGAEAPLGGAEFLVTVRERASPLVR